MDAICATFKTLFLVLMVIFVQNRYNSTLQLYTLTLDSGNDNASWKYRKALSQWYNFNNIISIVVFICTTLYSMYINKYNTLSVFGVVCGLTLLIVQYIKRDSPVQVLLLALSNIFAIAILSSIVGMFI